MKLRIVRHAEEGRVYYTFESRHFFNWYSVYAATIYGGNKIYATYDEALASLDRFCLKESHTTVYEKEI
jgi:hypothetical protein